MGHIFFHAVRVGAYRIRPPAVPAGDEQGNEGRFSDIPVVGAYQIRPPDIPTGDEQENEGRF